MIVWMTELHFLLLLGSLSGSVNLHLPINKVVGSMPVTTSSQSHNVLDLDLGDQIVVIAMPDI